MAILSETKILSWKEALPTSLDAVTWPSTKRRKIGTSSRRR
jgi:hypothetical protein